MIASEGRDDLVARDGVTDVEDDDPSGVGVDVTGPLQEFNTSAVVQTKGDEEKGHGFALALQSREALECGGGALFNDDRIVQTVAATERGV